VPDPGGTLLGAPCAASGASRSTTTVRPRRVIRPLQSPQGPTFVGSHSSCSRSAKVIIGVPPRTSGPTQESTATRSPRNAPRFRPEVGDRRSRGHPTRTPPRLVCHRTTLVPRAGSHCQAPSRPRAGAGNASPTVTYGAGSEPHAAAGLADARRTPPRRPWGAWFPGKVARCRVPGAGALPVVRSPRASRGICVPVRAPTRSFSRQVPRFRCSGSVQATRPPEADPLARTVGTAPVGGCPSLGARPSALPTRTAPRRQRPFFPANRGAPSRSEHLLLAWRGRSSLGWTAPRYPKSTAAPFSLAPESLNPIPVPHSDFRVALLAEARNVDQLWCVAMSPKALRKKGPQRRRESNSGGRPPPNNALLCTLTTHNGVRSHRMRSHPAPSHAPIWRNYP
jgi:hypothetical protein